MEVLFTFTYTALFSFLVYKYRFFQAIGISPKISVILFNLKVGAGLTLALIYTFYYTDRNSGDIYKYFNDGERIYYLLFSDPLAYFQIMFGINTSSPHIHEFLESTNHWFKPSENPLYNDNRTIIRFNALARIVSFGSLGVHTVLISFLSYVGILAVYKTIVQFLKGKEKELIIALFLLPSVIFWGSGALKEGILLFGMGIFLYAWHQLLASSFKFSTLLLLLGALIILLVSKIYVLLALLPPMIAYTWSYLTLQKHIALKYLAVFVFGFIGLLIIQHILPEVDILQMMATKQQDFINVAIDWNAKSRYDIPILEANLTSLLKCVPIAFGNVLFRPHLSEAHSVFMLMAALENLVILFMIAVCICLSKKKVVDWNFMFFCIGFVVILFSLIGLIVPILGAVVRYKIPALPFLLIIFLLIFDKEKLLSKFPRLKFLC